MLNEIKITGARTHNLKNVDLTLPKNKLIVFTGLSGSGKTSLAFDTIYAEGQRRYIESLSAYARQFLNQLEKPDVESIEGLSPAIAIDQKSASHNPRSTVGTVTEIYDYLRLLFTSIGQPHCWQCGRPVERQSAQEIVDQIMAWPLNTSILVLAPIAQAKKGEYRDVLDNLRKDGFSRLRVDGEIVRLSDEIKLDKKKKHTLEIVVDRLQITPEQKSRLFESVETSLKYTQGLVLIENQETKAPQLFSEQNACPDCHLSLGEVSPRLFSFNSPVGACPACNGLGDKLDFDPDLVIADPEQPLRNCTAKVINLDGTYYGMSAERTIHGHGFDMDMPFAKLTPAQKNIFLYGTTKDVSENPFISGQDKPTYSGIFSQWEGLITNLRRRYFQTHSEGMRFFFRSYMSAKPCETCQGRRLKKEATAYRIGGKNIGEVTALSLRQLLAYVTELALSPKEQEIAQKILREIQERARFLIKVGLEYITLDRSAHTLSGGEFQRIRLATQIGSGLTGVLYVLDEPSIGLHQRDNERLIETLLRLRDLGNTMLVIEHDEEMIRRADFVVDIGPGAGIKGGEVMYAGPVAGLLTSATSLTARFLQGQEKIAVPPQRRHFAEQKWLKVIGASENNLKNINAAFPLGKFICVTGVSGSGKSSLINDILHRALMRHFYKSKESVGRHTRLEGLEHVDKVITIDQSPIGRTPRSNPATYTDVFLPVRDLFTQTREAKIRGYKPGRFSFNVKGGRCEACEGDGVVKIEMHFLSDVYVTCDVCNGQRYNEQTLEVKYKGHSIANVLQMTVDEAAQLFENIPAISNKLKTLQSVGLGYIHLGQSATTLSGGEAQRIKLARELSKRSTGHTLYLLDEPTTGLHFEDIRNLLGILNLLVDAGNTLIVVEHNLDVIKTADHIIDLGPDGGDAGGQILATGTPEDIAQVAASYTGQFLAPLLTKT